MPSIVTFSLNIPKCFPNNSRAFVLSNSFTFCVSPIFSAVTNSKISGSYNHSSKYWLEDVTRIEKELSANIMSAYLTNNKDTLDIINSISGLKEIKEKVVKLYNDYTK